MSSLYLSSKRTKLAVTLVCRDWHRAALPLLYEFVHIHESNHHQLLEALLAPVDDIHTRCCFIRRLHIFHRNPSLITEFYTSVQQILQKCTRLETYTHSATDHQNGGQHLFQTLFTRCGHSLRQIKLGGLTLPPNFRDILSKAGSRLRIVAIKANVRIGGSQTPAPLILPHLHTLTLCYGITTDPGPAAFAGGEYRHLQCLKIKGSLQNIPNMPWLPDCPSLRAIDASEWSTSLDQTILARYPMLDTLIVSMKPPNHDASRAVNDVADIQLKNIGINCFWSAYQPPWILGLLTLFTDRRRFPFVQHIRILNFKAVMDILSPETWRVLDARMQELQCRFDDENGQLILEGLRNTGTSSNVQ